MLEPGTVELTFINPYVGNYEALSIGTLIIPSRSEHAMDESCELSGGMLANQFMKHGRDASFRRGVPSRPSCRASRMVESDPSILCSFYF